MPAAARTVREKVVAALPQVVRVRWGRRKSALQPVEEARIPGRWEVRDIHGRSRSSASAVKTG